MGNKIHDLRIYVLFCSVFLLGCMMEILYFPLLSFIYYYDRSSWGKN
ncbi:putative membrane protein [Bacteroides fragilis str. DS-166]|nr:putative membrane protein [Bacteroides fragilis str. DS-166]